MSASGKSASPRVRIVVSPRDRYNVARESLESLFESTHEPYELIYVTSRAPQELRDWIDAQARDRGFTHIAETRYLTPNEARNRGAAGAAGDYIAFVDNDVLFSPGWLSALVQCADETGAAITAPLTCQGLPAHTEIHQAGGQWSDDPSVFFATPPGQRPIMDVTNRQGEKVADVVLERGPTQACEFHTTLVRRDVFEAIGGLDENVINTKEHLDLCMSVIRDGGKVMFEPKSVVTFVVPCRASPVLARDWPFFLLRWSPQWQRRTFAYLRRKWGLREDAFAFPAHAWPIHFRYHEGVVRPMVRGLGWLAKPAPLHGLAYRLASRVTHGWGAALTAATDRARRDHAST